MNLYIFIPHMCGTQFEDPLDADLALTPEGSRRIVIGSLPRGRDSSTTAGTAI